MDLHARVLYALARSAAAVRTDLVEGGNEA